MSRDHIVEEVRRIRRQILEECDGDLNKYFDRLKALEARHADRLVRSADDVRASCSPLARVTSEQADE